MLQIRSRNCKLSRDQYHKRLRSAHRWRLLIRQNSTKRNVLIGHKEIHHLCQIPTESMLRIQSRNCKFARVRHQNRYHRCWAHRWRLLIRQNSTRPTILNSHPQILRLCQTLLESMLRIRSRNCRFEHVRKKNRFHCCRSHRWRPSIRQNSARQTVLIRHPQIHHLCLFPTGPMLQIWSRNCRFVHVRILNRFRRFGARPMATVDPSELSETEVPDQSFSDSPSMSDPTWVQVEVPVSKL
jgi:hypothetical protein